MHRNFQCAAFDDMLLAPANIPTVEDCFDEAVVGIAHGGEIVEEYLDVIVTWTYDCYNDTWIKDLSYKDITIGEGVTTNCNDTTGQVTNTVTQYSHPCETANCGPNETCDGEGECVPNYIHPCDSITLGDCELCDGKGDIYKLPSIATDILCVDGDAEKAKVIWKLDCQNNATYSNLDGTPYTGDATGLGVCCCIGEPCEPDCSCAATTLIGMTCPDKCGGTCDGTLDNSCTPNCPDTDTYCPDDPIPDSGCPEVTCGKGTKDCSFCGVEAEVVATLFDLQGGEVGKAVSEDVSALWGLPSGSVTISSNDVNTQNNSDAALTTSDSASTTWTVSGTQPVKITVQHGKNISESGIDGFTSLDGVTYSYVGGSLKAGYTDTSSHPNYQVTAPPTSDGVDQATNGVNPRWLSDAPATSVEIYTTNTPNFNNNYRLFLTPCCE